MKNVKMPIIKHPQKCPCFQCLSVSKCYPNQAITRVIKHKTAEVNIDLYSYKFHNLSLNCLRRYKDFNVTDCPPSALCQASLCLFPGIDSWPGTRPGQETGGIAAGLNRKDPLLENNCYFRSGMYQHRHQPRGRHLKEGKSYVISAQINVSKCWFGS